jgi:mono/diheme cytochrome c family protein
MNRTFILIAIAACAAVLGLFAAVAVQILHDGLGTKATPTKIESMLARNLRHLAIPSGAKRQVNPVPSSNEIVHQGMLHFADHCASCHGNDGSGDSLFGKGLYPKPPDLRLDETQKLSNGELFWIIENGVRFTGMPGFGNTGTQEDSWKLVRFIRHLPQLSADERAEMERNNPKSPGDRLEEKQEEDFLNGKPSAPLQPSEHHHH